MNKRSSGILLHVTSLPGREGIGTLGNEAFAWIDLLQETGQRLWQILPLGPAGYGNSPYQCYSAFAGNPLLIDLFMLQEEGLLEEADLQRIPAFDQRQVEFDKIEKWKFPLLRKAFQQFIGETGKKFNHDYERFLDENNWWLADYALFAAAKAHFNTEWMRWPHPLKFRQPDALVQYRTELSGEIAFRKFLEFCFFRQWKRVKEYAGKRGVHIVGDIPLYVSTDSADVWANPSIFQLDEELNPIRVGGVPPDYFSKSGQLWGNPVFDWERLKADDYSWWIARIHFNLRLFDFVRIDHFRGLESFWSVPADEKTAENGAWVPAHGRAVLKLLRKQIGKLPLVAEDLGLITPEVEKLRDDFNLPGMKVLHFAFLSDEKNEHLPHNYTNNCIVYTGTHDNDTTWAWLHAAEKAEKKRAASYLQHFHRKPAWGLIEMAWASTAVWALTPLQDLLELGAEARMNIPGLANGNWGWRFRTKQLHKKQKRFLSAITKKYNR